MSDKTAAEIARLKGRLAEEVLKNKDAEDRIRVLEEALKKNEERNNALFNAASDAIMLIDPKSACFINFNTKAHSNLGYSREEFKQLGIVDIDIVWNKKEIHLLCAEILQDGHRSFETKHRAKDNKAYNMLINATKISIKVRDIIQYICTDITSHKQTKDELKDSKDKYRDLFHNSQVGLSRTRANDGKLLEANDRLASMFGYKDRHQMLDEFYAPSAYEHQRDREHMIQTIIKDGEIQDYEVFARRKDGSNIWVRYSAKLYPEQGYLDVVVVDITKEKNAEKEKEYLYNKLAQSQKMEAVGRLSAGIAHDFNNLLTVIKTMTYKSKKETNNTPALHRYLSLIDTAAEGAKNLTQKLLIFSKKQTMTFVTIDVNKLISNLKEVLQNLVGSGIRIELDLHDDLFTIYGDRGSFEQAIINLAINARDAMPGGGLLMIKTENANTDGAKTLSMISVTITDNGVGMDKETSRRIFEPFFTTKPQGEGTGLGASVVFGIVKDHKGIVEVESTLDVGTSIKLLFPPAPKRSILTGKMLVSNSIDLSGMGEHILLVEDNALIRETTSLLLSENNYLVTVTNSAEDALELFKDDPESFDYLLSDVVLPGKNGIELAGLILLIKPGLPILLSSAYTSNKLQWDEIRDEGLAFIRKPYDSTDLLCKIRKDLQANISVTLQTSSDQKPPAT